jgi:hypothetical protein
MRSRLEEKGYEGYRRKIEPTTLYNLYETLPSMGAIHAFSARRNQLQTYLRRSPVIRHNATLTTEFSRAYSECGLFGRSPAVRREADSIANSPHLIDHLRVMDEIKARVPRR